MKYPLLTQKKAYFILWVKAIELIKNKEHLTLKGVQKIVNLKASINWGLTDVLKLAFPNTIQVLRPLVEVPKTFDSNWIAGFVSAEGCFMVKIK